MALKGAGKKEAAVFAVDTEKLESEDLAECWASEMGSKLESASLAYANDPNHENRLAFVREFLNCLDNGLPGNRIDAVYTVLSVFDRKIALIEKSQKKLEVYYKPF